MIGRLATDSPGSAPADAPTPCQVADERLAPLTQEVCVTPHPRQLGDDDHERVRSVLPLRGKSTAVTRSSRVLDGYPVKS